MGNQDRTLELRIVSIDSPDLHIPFSLLEKMLRFIQQALFHAGDYQAGWRPRKKGPFPKEVLEQCELFVTGFTLGSLHVNASLPEPDPLLLPEEDLGTKALHTMGAALYAVSNDDEAGLATAIADRTHRTRFLKAVEGAMPDEAAPYGLNLLIAHSASPVYLRPKTRQTILRLIHPEEARAEDRKIVGELVLLKISGGRNLGIKLDDGRVIVCHFTPDQENFITQQVVGSVVEVTGRASLAADGVIQTIDDVYDVVPVDFRPLRIKVITVGSRRFHLKKPISVELDFQDSVWSYEYLPLGIITCSPSRSEALSQFWEEFEFIWEEYAQERDENLTLDAQELKRHLLELVESVTESEDE